MSALTLTPYPVDMSALTLTPYPVDMSALTLTPYLVDMSALTLTPYLVDMSALRELDIRAGKKEKCKITPEFIEQLRQQHCTVRGGVVKKAKGAKKKTAK